MKKIFILIWLVIPYKILAYFTPHVHTHIPYEYQSQNKQGIGLYDVLYFDPYYIDENGNVHFKSNQIYIPKNTVINDEIFEKPLKTKNSIYCWILILVILSLIIILSMYIGEFIFDYYNETYGGNK